MHGSVNILNTIELDTQKMVKMVKLLFCVLITHMYTHTHTHTKSKGAKILFGNIRYQISEISDSKCFRKGTSLAAQWLELHASSTEGQGSIPSPGTKISGIAKKLKQNKKYTIRGKLSSSWDSRAA